MNIKSITTPVRPVDIKPANQARETKTEGSHERDAQAFYGNPNQEQKKRKLTDDEINEVIEHLKGLPFAKDNNWTIRADKTGNMTVVYVTDSEGKIIRRIPEQDLWGLWMQKSSDQTKGNLLNKAL